MNQQELEAKVKEVFSDKAYVEGLLKLETAEEVQASLKEKGLELSIDDIMKIKETIEKSQDGELDDEALESVNGGILGMMTAIIIAGFVGLGVIATELETGGRW